MKKSLVALSMVLLTGSVFANTLLSEGTGSFPEKFESHLSRIEVKNEAIKANKSGAIEHGESYYNGYVHASSTKTRAEVKEELKTALKNHELDPKIYGYNF